MSAERVRLTARGKTVDAVVVLRSPNGHALFLEFDDTIGLRDGMLLGGMPLIRVGVEGEGEGGGWLCALDGSPVTLEWPEDPSRRR